MKVVLKPLFDVLTGDVAVMDNILYNYLILIAVGEIAFQTAWNFVDNLYHMGVINGKASGSAIHWFVRLIVYIVCVYIIRGGVWLYEFIAAVPYWIWWILLGTIVVAILVAIPIIIIRKKRVKVENAPK